MNCRLNMRTFGALMLLVVLSAAARGQERQDGSGDMNEDDLKFIVFWEGTEPVMRLDALAAYCAPVFWFSPDEPELKEQAGKDIRIPAAFPFDEQVDVPVVYYQLRYIIQTADGAFSRNASDIGASLVDLRNISGFEFDYNHYYRFEVGLGKHNHDTEQAQFKIYVHSYEKAGVTHYQLYLLQATAKAHALAWYDNIYKVNPESLNFELALPFHIMVEEGKHASVCDMNADGYYTPGYDVNVRTNDAWGLRDVIRTGELFSASFEAWMAKVRKPQHKVFPPLPADSPHRERWSKDGVYAPDNAVYELRPMPAPEAALPDEVLAHDMSGYYSEGWPSVRTITAVDQFLDWWEAENLIKSLAVAARVDDGKWGVAFNFPLLIVKNVEAPLVGGWLVNRIYLQNDELKDLGWNLLYTPSASRFLDPYFAAGVEFQRISDPGEDLRRKGYFVFETGVKFRGNVKYSPLKFLGVLTDFWGMRLGMKYRNFMSVDQISYVFEIGAGVW